MDTAAIRNAAERLAAILAELEAMRGADESGDLEDAVSFIQSAIDSLDNLATAAPGA